MLVVGSIRLNSISINSTNAAAGAKPDVATLVPIGDLPDIITILDVGSIVCRGRLETLAAQEEQLPFDGELLKSGSYDNERWSGLALAAFEIAARAENVDWGKHVSGVLAHAVTEVERYHA